MAVKNYTNSRNVTVMFVNTGNEVTTQKWNILKGFVRDSKLSQEMRDARDEEERAAALERKASLKEVRRQVLSEKKSEAKQRRESRFRWYAIVRDMRCHFDSEGKWFYGTTHTDRTGFTFQVVAKAGFNQSTWLIVYDGTLHKYWVPEYDIKRGVTLDKLNPLALKAEKLRVKLANAMAYEADRERKIAMASAYQKNNVEKTRVRNRNRRARRIGAEGTHTVEDTLSLLAEQDNKCACCGIELTERTRELDHKMPLVLGGSNSIENLQWLCQFCNCSKNGSHPDDWHTYSTSEAFKRRRTERLSSEHEDWKLIVQSMPPLAGFSLCCG